jgi:hypothetical protein
MSDGVIIPLDVDDTRARTKVARLKKEAGQAGRAYGQAGAQAARVGGAAGGALGRGIGGFSQGMGAGFLGLGLAGGGMLLSSFLQRDGERQTMAREREGRSHARAADARTVIERKDAQAVGGLSFGQRISRMAFRGGGESTLKGYASMARSYGLTTSQGLDIYDAANEFQGINPEDIALGMATGVLGGSANQVAGAIQKFNGLQNAIAATQNITGDQAAGALEAFKGNPLALAVANANIQGNPVEDAQIAALLSGETEAALARQTRDTLNPGARLALEASRKVMESVNLLRAAAEAESGVAALLAEMGRVVGLSDGSATRKLAVGAEAASE